MLIKNRSISYAFVALLIIATLSLGVNTSKTKFPGMHPGYAEQRAQMKQNENGEIPRSMWKQWRDETPKVHGKIDFFKEVNELGPSNIGGRTRAMIVDTENSNHLIAGGASGGIWTSNNGGISWTPLDDDAITLTVTGLVQNPFNPKEIYYTTGERSTGVYINYDGNGIFKSVDGGKTFNQIDSSDIPAFDKTWDIAYSLTDSNTFYIATIDNGLYRTTDKGKTYNQIFKSGSSDINDVDVTKSGRVYFSCAGKGIYWFDEAETPKINQYSISVSGFDRCLVEASPSNPDVIYAAFASNTGNGLQAIYKSMDGGNKWTKLSDPTNIGVRYNFTWYCFTLGIHPTNPDFVICAAQESAFSTDGGDTWTEMANSHADYHNVTFVPNSNDFYMLNDGGIYQYNTATSAFTAFDRNNGYNITQFYAGSFNPTGDEVMVGAQDNWTTTNTGGTSIFSQVLGGDGAFNAIDKTGEHIYASSQNANIRRWSGTRWVNIYNSLRSVVGSTGFWFINPFELNPTNGEEIYFPTKNYVARSTNGGTNWTRITDPISGSAFCIALTPEENPDLYLGGESGILYRIDDAKTAEPGDIFKMFTLAPVTARGGFIGNIEIDPNDKSTIYLAMSNYSPQPRIWKVEDADTDSPEWVDISGNLPTSLPVNWIEVDPANSDHIVVATDYGLYVTGDGGRFWHKEERIPNVYISMVRLRESDRRLYVFTYGRGVWTAQLNSDVNAEVTEVKNPQVLVYPNPATHSIRIANTSIKSARVYGPTGEQHAVNMKEDGQLDVSSLAVGNYFVQFIDADGNKSVARFVKN